MNGLREYITGDFDPIDQPDLALYEVELLISNRPAQLFKGKEAAFEYAMFACRKITGKKQERNEFQVFNADSTVGSYVNALVRKVAAHDQTKKAGNP